MVERRAEEEHEDRSGLFRRLLVRDLEESGYLSADRDRQLEKLLMEARGAGLPVEEILTAALRERAALSE